MTNIVGYEVKVKRQNKIPYNFSIIGDYVSKLC